MILRQATCTVYVNRWMIALGDQVEFSNGSTRDIYGVVDKPDFVTVVLIDTSGNIHLVRQYRYPVEGACRRRGAFSRAPVIKCRATSGAGRDCLRPWSG